ncbi:hypothetical protein BXZ70DRAFT_909529 [Cristinia sonorae]|uniref:Serine protease inhibitor n=1 Tax=Cristinia sonorae TaxID=1940300 RepID=A0A8K0UIN4_9AGAR|nr:hypothetical protein BXZ70DRAFT_909529 [Cristinia sonorae]
MSSNVLLPGSYHIQSVKTGRFIARAHPEDLSPLPKPVYHLPAGEKPAQIWIVENATSKNSNGFYILRNGGNPIGRDNELVYAIISEGDGLQPEMWKVSCQEQSKPDEFVFVFHPTVILRQHNDSGYRILSLESEDCRNVWAVPEHSEEHGQVFMLPVPTPDNASRYPPAPSSAQVFKFIPVQGEGY